MLGMFDMFDIDGSQILYNLLTMVAAFVLAMPLGWHRKRSSHSVGFRTFPLVALASAGYILIGRTVLGPNSPEFARLIQGLITGIGFLGGGAIVKHESTVAGTATAASIWNTAAIGAAVAFDRYEIAVTLSLANFLVLWVLTPVGEKVDDLSEESGDDEVE
ncbi:MAG: MgtC/SapB family protein [Myxococcota bacterium]